MADVDINKFRASVVRDGSKPASPGFIVSEGQDPVNPPGTNNYVPYSGATANVELGEYGVEAGFITLDTTPTNTPTDQGTIFWDADDETVDIVLNGYTMKIGEDLFYPVKNQTGSTIAKGVAVRFNGTVGNSGRLLIAPFIADGSVPSSRFMGVTAEEILNGEDGKVLYFGRVRGINTNAFNEGDILYASTTVAGAYQTAIPVAPNNIVQVAAVISKSATVGTIFVRPTLGSNINKDEGVKITSVADKNLLQYQSGTSLWENKTLAQVIGSDYVPSTRTITINGVGQDLSANRTYNVGTVTSVGLSSATSGVTIGSTPVTTSGTITLAIATASGLQNGLLSSTDWTTFNGKQNALTNPVTGTGASGRVAFWNGTNSITSDADLLFDGSNLTINGTATIGSSTYKLLSISDAGGAGWATTGGASTSPQLYLFGTGTSALVQTYINNVAKLEVSNAGISVNGSITSIGVNKNMILGSVVGATGYNFITLNSSLSDGLGIGLIGGATGDESLYINAGNGGNVVLRTGTGTTYNTRIIAYGATGNVGIGTPPASDNGANLQVSGAATVSSNIAIGGTITSLSDTDELSIFAGTSVVDNRARIELYGPSHATLANQTFVRGSQITFTSSASSTQYMTINSIGNVMIGTGSPAQRLHVIDSQTSNTSILQLRLEGNGGNFYDIGRRYDSGAFVIQGNQTGFNNICLAPSGGNVLIGTTTDNGARLQVSGRGSFAGSSTVTGTVFISSGNQWSLNADQSGGGSPAFAGSGFYLRNENNSTIALGFNSGGAATFSSTLRATEITASMPSGNGALYINNSSLTNKNWTFIPQTSSGETDLLLFYTGAAAGTRLTVTNSGNVVIGNTVASNVGLTIFGSNAATIYQTSNTGTGAGNGFYVGHTGDISYVWNYNNFPLVLATNNTERMRITSGGSVGINNTSPVNTAWGNETTTKQLSIDATNYAVINLQGSTGRKYSMGVGDGNFYMCYDNTAARHNITVTSGGNVLIGTTTSGSSRLRIVGLPTSAAGLSSGDVWSDSGTLKIA